MKNFIQRGWWNLICTAAVLGILVFDVARGADALDVGIDVGSLAALLVVCAFIYLDSRPSGGEIQTFEQGETDVLVSLSKGTEPVPIPGESYDPDPHKLGDRPDSCSICASMIDKWSMGGEV